MNKDAMRTCQFFYKRKDLRHSKKFYLSESLSVPLVFSCPLYKNRMHLNTKLDSGIIEDYIKFIRIGLPTRRRSSRSMKTSYYRATILSHYFVIHSNRKVYQKSSLLNRTRKWYIYFLVTGFLIRFTFQL